MKLSLAGLAFLCAIPCWSSAFTIEASIPPTPVNQTTSESTFSQDYTLLITGGTGSGWAVFSYTLSGATNESEYPWAIQTGATAQLNIATRQGTTYLSVGDWTGPAGSAGLPYLACDGSSLFTVSQSPSPPAPCFIPFTFGVSQTIHVEAVVQAMYDVDPLFLLDNPGWVVPGGYSGTVQFDGVTGFTTTLDPVYACPQCPKPGDTISFDAVPEPSFALLLLCFAVGLTTVRYRQRERVQVRVKERRGGGRSR